MKYDFTYGMARPHHTVYCLYDPKYQDVPRYVGVTDGNPVWRLGRHLGETWGLDSQKEKNLKQRWIRAIISKGRMPNVKTIYETASRDNAWKAESVLITYLWKGLTNGAGVCGEKTYKKRKNSNDGKLVLESIHKKYKNLDPNYKGIELGKVYPGIFEGTGYE